jgi:hypothetical protein
MIKKNNDPMSATISYSILFEVKVLHHYFLNRGENDFEKMPEEEKARVMLNYDVREIFNIVPTDECRGMLDSHQCLFKTTSQGLLVGLRAKPDGQDPSKFKPFKEPSAETRFTFRLELRDFGFMNYTALPLAGNEGRVYVFRNLEGGQPRQYPSLSATPALFDNTREYMPGDILSNNLNNPAEIYIARLKTTNNTSTASDWLKEKKTDGFKMSYANENDRHRLVQRSFKYLVTTAGAEPVATIKNEAGDIVTPKVIPVPGDFTTIHVDMRGFPEGFYSMHLESLVPPYADDLSFYLTQERTAPFGILEVQVKSDVDAYNMLDAQGFMLSPAYELRFRNRATHWRYVGKDFNGSSFTALPLSLTRFGYIENVKVKDKDGVEVDDLPNPSNTMIKTEAMIEPAEKRFYSEIHINKS